MFRSTTIIRELKLSLAIVILILKHSVRLRRNLLCGGVVACCIYCFGLRPSSGSLQLSLVTVILILKHSVSYVVICYALVWQHAATPPHNKLRRNLTECFNINITLARFNCKLPDDGGRPKHVGVI